MFGSAQHLKARLSLRGVSMSSILAIKVKNKVVGGRQAEISLRYICVLQLDCKTCNFGQSFHCLPIGARNSLTAFYCKLFSFLLTSMHISTGETKR